ncbi:MAG: hypothetical protein C0618_07705 [Desulfuromonas sp.]|nr:MAG: hypothetical protein C0618_07705 [Desulfuromonas sp.]
MRKLKNMEEFKRDIEYRVKVQDDESILLTGTMQDRFHDIAIDVVVDGDSLAIIDCHAIFLKVPSPYCGRVLKRFDLLKGVVIGKGLSRSLATVFGGQEGCGNLRTLLIGLLPLALNVRASVGTSDEEELLDTIHQHLKGTCAGYPAEGESQKD